MWYCLHSVRIIVSGITLLLVAFVLSADRPGAVGMGLGLALVASSVAEFLAVRLAYCGTVSFGIVVYVPLICLPEFGPSLALIVAFCALAFREILVYSDLPRLVDETVLDLLPLSMAAMIPILIGPDEADILTWVGVGLTFISVRYFVIRLRTSTLSAKDKATVERLQIATSDLRWGILGLSLLAIPIAETNPFMGLALIPVLASFRKAAIHAYAWLDKEDKKKLRSVAGRLSATLKDAESEISKLSDALQVTEVERNLLFDLSRETVGCGSFLELLPVVERKARSLELGRHLNLLLVQGNEWFLLKLDRSGKLESGVSELKGLEPGVRECWQSSKPVTSQLRHTGRGYYPLPGVGVLTLEQKPESLKEETQQVLSLFCSQLSLACLSVRRFEEVKKALEQLRASEAQLIESAKLAAVGQLSAGLAHEINNPLGTIRLAIDFALRKEQISDTSKGLLEKALTGVARAESITGSLLSYSRAGGKGRTKVDAWTVLFDACAFLEASLRSQNIFLDYPPRSGKIEVLANSQELQQILTNLLLNARDALEGSKVMRIAIRAGLQEGHFVIEVHDSGPGVDPEIADRIFDPFFTTKSVGKGTGLGLSVSREMAGANEGSLQHGRSDLLGGACFRLVLPALP